MFRYQQFFTVLLSALASVAPTFATPPQGQNDALLRLAGTRLDIKASDLLDNDSDADGEPLNIAFIDDVINGSARYDKDTGLITFWPPENFVGRSQFTYVISDGYNGNDYSRYGFALVTIDFTGAGDSSAPDAVAENFTGEAKVNDTDRDGKAQTKASAHLNIHPHVTKNRLPLGNSDHTDTQKNATLRLDALPADNRSKASKGLVFRTGAASSEQRSYFFGHSLIYHTFTDYPRTSELSVPHWMNHLSQAKGARFLANGSFRTATYALPAIDGWGFAPDISAWAGNFANSDFDSVVFTEINYVQYQSPSTPYHGGGPDDTPLNLALRALDYALQQEPGITFYLYECWPDAGGFAPNYDPPSGQDIDPSRRQVANYYAYAQGDYHQWWLTLQDALIQARPDAKIKLVPVGPILSKLLSTANIGELEHLAFRDLYEDNAPHGRPSIYFLAALIQHMGMFREPAPSKVDIPDVIHPQIRAHYSEIVDFIWRELNNFNRADDTGRLW